MVYISYKLYIIFRNFNLFSDDDCLIFSIKSNESLFNGEKWNNNNLAMKVIFSIQTKSSQFLKFTGKKITRLDEKVEHYDNDIIYLYKIFPRM